MKKFISCFPKLTSASTLLAAFGIVYPVLVYVGLHYLPPIVVVSALFVPLALKFFFDRRNRPNRAFAYVSLLAVAGAAALIAFSPLTGLKSYPILVNLGFASVFGYSLVYPPTIIERIARFRSTNLSPPPINYLRKVTIAWLIFFLLNASVSLWTAAATTIEVWTLYNGFIAYVLMSLLFAGEFLVRWRLQSRRSRVS